MNMSAWLSPLETATRTSGAASLSLSLGDEIRWKNGLLDKRHSVRPFIPAPKQGGPSFDIYESFSANSKMRECPPALPQVMEVDGDPARVVE